MREIEVFLPLSFLGARTVEGTADLALTLATLAWSGIFLFFPLFNRDRLRVGDLVAGTWVVMASKTALTYDLVAAGPAERRTFSDAALNLYGVYELQTLEEVRARRTLPHSRPSRARSGTGSALRRTETITAFCPTITRRFAPGLKPG